MRLFGSIVAAALAATPAFAIVGGSSSGSAERYTVLIVSTGGAVCSGTAIGRDLVLTAAHCVARPGNYAIVRKLAGTQQLVPVARVVLHPGFSADSFRTRKPTPDLALLKTALPLPQALSPAAIARDTALPRPGERFLIAGWGQTAENDPRSVGTLRALSLPAVGTTGGIMVRLSTPGTLGGSCDGDSGGSVFRDNGRFELAGVIGWATGPKGRGCGGVTGATLVGLHAGWIVETARALGGRLGE
jgi:hypothetical protein